MICAVQAHTGTVTVSSPSTLKNVHHAMSKQRYPISLLELFARLRFWIYNSLQRVLQRHFHVEYRRLGSNQEDQDLWVTSMLLIHECL